MCCVVLCCWLGKVFLKCRRKIGGVFLSFKMGGECVVVRSRNFRCGIIFSCYILACMFFFFFFFFFFLKGRRGGEC